MVRGNLGKVWRLAPREHLLLDDAQGTTLRVTRGTLWITLEHDLRDIVISAGEAFTVDRRGRTIVEAQSPATVRVNSHSRGRAILRGIARLLDRWMQAAVRAAEHRRHVPHY